MQLLPDTQGADVLFKGARRTILELIYQTGTTMALMCKEQTVQQIQEIIQLPMWNKHLRVH